MIIRSIRIKEGLFSRFIEFSANVNLIHSKQNSKGKTTLLRFLLYSLGYNIPNTRKIKFERCEVETVVYTEKIGDVTLSRTANSHIVLSANDDRTTYVLPEQQNELHSVLFGTDNADILGNLLGAFYVDQEKGWTLLNRGVAIGSIHFNIEELIRGLSGRDCAPLIQQEAKLSRELGKYKQMFSVAQYQETIEVEEGSLAVEHYDERIDSELEQLRIRQSALKKELRRLDKAIKDNRQFSKFIAEMKLLIKGPDGTTIPVTAENIVGFDDSIHCKDHFHKIFDKMKEADGIILGSPVYTANLSANMQALLERCGVVTDMNRDAGLFRYKVGAAVTAARRGGAVNALDAMNHFFLSQEMFVVGSCYWPLAYGQMPGDVEKDVEGLETMRVLGRTWPIY